MRRALASCPLSLSFLAVTKVFYFLLLFFFFFLSLSLSLTRKKTPSSTLSAAAILQKKLGKVVAVEDACLHDVHLSLSGLRSDWFLFKASRLCLCVVHDKDDEGENEKKRTPSKREKSVSVFVSKVRRGDSGVVCDLKWQNGHHKQQQTFLGVIRQN